MVSVKRIFSWFLALLILVGSVPAVALAESDGEVFVQSLIADPDSEDGEELLDGYIYQLFYGQIATYRRKAGDRLTGNTKILYDALVPILRQIAAGERTSTTIGVGRSVYTNGGTLAADAQATFTAEEVNYTALIDALLTDLPYEMYWYDKTGSTSIMEFGGATISQIRIGFPVAWNYHGSESFTVECQTARSAAQAAANSAAVVARYADKTDYEKLVGYKDEICRLTDYDYDAAWEGNFSEDDDPWQLIHVFDGDSTTNVVCEGYAKAFMYLCQQTDFAGDVTCITVYGMMGGAHMWNIVTLEGQNYLVDVTNSEDDAVGYDGSLFLAGGTGSIAEGYRVNGWDYTYTDYNGALNRIVQLWGADDDSILNLASRNYEPPQGVQITAVNLRPESAGIYFAGSFAVSGNTPVARRGIAVSLRSQTPVADNSDPLSFWTEGKTSILVTNILDTDQDAASNGSRAAMPIYARAYVQLTDGTYIYSDVVAMNLQQVAEAADTKWQTLDDTQKTELSAMFAKFQSVMTHWNLPNLKNN